MCLDRDNLCEIQSSSAFHFPSTFLDCDAHVLRQWRWILLERSTLSYVETDQLTSNRIRTVVFCFEGDQDPSQMLEESKQVADNMAEADRNHVLRFVEEQETLKSHLDNIYVLGKVHWRHLTTEQELHAACPAFNMVCSTHVVIVFILGWYTSGKSNRGASQSENDTS